MASRAFFDFTDRTAASSAEQRSQRANRRRLLVFASVFLVLSVVGLVYVFSRPAIYQSAALLNFVSAPAQPAADDASQPAAKRYSVPDEVQYLTSRTLLETVVDRLKQSSPLPVPLQGADPAAALQSMLSVRQVPGTNIVSVRAEGREPALLSLVVERLVATYRESLAQRFKSGSADALVEARDEAARLDANVLDKRREVDAFRARNNIVSLERDENQVLSEVKGVGAALNAANEKVVTAEARLGALKEAEAAGQSIARAKDNPMLAALEQQAGAIRGDLRETARTFTPEYMQIDPRIRSLRARLAEIDEQIVAQRKSSQQGAMQEAREELAGARAAVAALRQQLATNQNAVQSFTSRFNEYKALQEQLAHLEALRQKAADRLVALDAGELGRTPKIEVVEPAATPQSPSSPLYARDAGLVLFGALLIALLTMGVVELFNRPPVQPATVVVPQTWTATGMAEPMAALPAMRTHQALADAPPSRNGSPSASLPAPLRLPRELTAAEVDALWTAAEPELRAAIALLLCGLTPDEVVALRIGDVDPAGQTVHVRGDAERSVPLSPPSSKALDAIATAEHRPADAPLLKTPNGRAMRHEDLATGLLYAAHDAELDDADAVTPEALRHTYVAYLVRQGMRFADLARRVGSLPADRLADYRRLAPGGSSAGGTPVDLAFPAPGADSQEPVGVSRPPDPRADGSA